MACKYDVNPDQFTGEPNTHPKLDDNPFFEMDHDRCILCGRCIRSCEEIRLRSAAIGYSDRGHQTKVGPPLDKSLTKGSCEFCGQCVQGI